MANTFSRIYLQFVFTVQDRCCLKSKNHKKELQKYIAVLVQNRGAKSHIDAVVKYVQTQEKHHEKKTFRGEYLEFLNKFDIAFEEKYLF